MSWSVGISGCGALLPAIALAFQPLITDDTGTQGTGGNQIEISYNRSVTESPGTKDRTHELPLVFTRGVTDALDLYGGLTRQRSVATVADSQLDVNPDAIYSSSKDFAFGFVREIMDGDVRTTQATVGLTWRFR